MSDGTTLSENGIVIENLNDGTPSLRPRIVEDGESNNDDDESDGIHVNVVE